MQHPAKMMIQLMMAYRMRMINRSMICLLILMFPYNNKNLIFNFIVRILMLALYKKIRLLRKTRRAMMIWKIIRVRGPRGILKFFYNMIPMVSLLMKKRNVVLIIIWCKEQVRDT